MMATPFPWVWLYKTVSAHYSKDSLQNGYRKAFFVHSPCMVSGPLYATPGTTHRKQNILWYHEKDILYLVVIQKNMSNDFDLGSLREKT